MTNFKYGKIYKIEPIVEHEEGDIYIGSTTKFHLWERLEAHRGDYSWYKTNKTVSRKLTSFDLFDKYGVDNCKIVLIENVSYHVKEELLSREGYYIKLLKCVNRVVPRRTKREYYLDNHEQKKAEAREYFRKNKDRLNKKCVCEICFHTYQSYRRAKHQKYKYCQAIKATLDMISELDDLQKKVNEPNHLYQL